jgi:PAS domain S-box-containing protein
MKLLESEERYRSLVENLNDAVFTVNQDGLITYVSQAGERQYGYTSSDLIGKPFTNIVYKEDIPALMDRFHNIGKGLISPFEWRLLHQDGSLSWVRTSTRPVEDSTGSSSFFGIISNISQQKKDEEAIRQANRKLSLLTGITRHDINNQLMVLNGFLQLLHNKVKDPALEDYFTRVNRVSARISSIIQFTKEYEEIGVSDPTWQDCHVLVDKSLEDAPLGTVRVNNDLPSGAEIFADPLISKVFYNLMDNAVRYGGTITTIRFSSEQRGSDHILFCEDDGAGIPIEEKEKIFDRGYGKNTGLGLALSREILSITGITISETGEPGRGSRFEMVVPAGMWRLGGPDTTGV